ncbi:MAG TPA: Hsp20/alpha crystallin family protein [Candidatus Binatia bacterium]|jgi:HSP20 family protein|nr:Hsp20/alpha crystallin family protein [Candidatus Binatia bacterium]
MAEKTVPQYASEQETSEKEDTRSQERYVTPAVDIYETLDGLVVKADLPGVTKDGLDLRVENNLLTIRGRASHCAPGEMLYREYQLANFFRQFELSDRVDQQNISAELKHGVLTLNLPKAEEAKPRKIDVRVA